MKCPLCRAEAVGDSRFCSACGAELPKPDAREGATRTLDGTGAAFGPGTLFAGRYRIIEEAGRGGMGIVYKAMDTAIQEKVALKVLSPEIADDPRFLDRFRGELKAARQVTHTNVVRVHDLGREGDVAYLTMEFAPGETLRSILAMAGRLDVQTAVDYGRQICAGLAEAHRAGIVHRDLKPQNLMIDDRHRLRILDFGLAGGTAAGPVGRGGAAGTPGYMAPEQIEGRGADARTDLYAVGLILYEMLTGKSPFKADARHASGTPRPDVPPFTPAALNPAVPAALNDLVLRCLDREPEKRPASAAAVGAKLAEIAAASAPLSDGRARATILGRVPKAGVAAALVLAAVLIALWIARPGTGPPPPEGWDGRLAVLPIEDASPAHDQAMLCDGLAENLREKLAASGGLKIISKYSSEQFRDSSTGPEAVGRALGARHIVSGRLDRHDGTLSIEIRMTDAGRRSRSWRIPYRGPAADFFAIQARIAADVMDRLTDFRSESVPPAPAAADPVNLEAYTDLLMGKRFEYRYRLGDAAADFDEAARLYGAALAHDARYTRALRGLGDLHEARFVKQSDPTDLALMLEHYRRAYEVDPKLPESLLAVGWTYFYQQNPAEAARFFQKALGAGPRDATVLLETGAFLRSLGLYEKASSYFEKAIRQSRETDPLSINPSLQLASCRGYLGRSADAETILRSLTPTEAERTRVRLLLSRQLLAQGRIEEARAELEAAGDPAKLAPTLKRSYDQYRLWLEAALGRRDEALRLIKASDRPFGYEIVNADLLLGRKAEALAAIRDGIARGFLIVKDYLYRPAYLLGNPLFAGLQTDPEFKRILAEQTETERRWSLDCAGL